MCQVQNLGFRDSGDFKGTCFSYLSQCDFLFSSLLDPILSLWPFLLFDVPSAPNTSPHLFLLPPNHPHSHEVSATNICRSLWGWAPGSGQQVSKHQIPGILFLEVPRQQLPGLPLTVPSGSHCPVQFDLHSVPPPPPLYFQPPSLSSGVPRGSFT